MQSATEIVTLGTGGIEKPDFWSGTMHEQCKSSHIPWSRALLHKHDHVTKEKW